ncbi:MAG: nitroreductase family deazaflavin-dependent oxidoreductase [Chloroflexia bacterium]|nr:nitroreductase family deazaflavin-dependent oxidoreductase [Chloroflexia bacterium]
MHSFLPRMANPFVRALLRSPLHGLLSHGVMLITVTGRRTGRPYTLPVQYIRRGDTIDIVSTGDRRWWRNVESGGQVMLRIGNETLIGAGSVLRGAAAAEAAALLDGTALGRAARRTPNPVIIRVDVMLSGSVSGSPQNAT